MTTHPHPSVVPPERRGWQLLLVPVLVGSLVALTLGIYGGLHEGTGIAVNIAGFTDHEAPTSAAKATLATAAVLFALLQVASAFVMYGRVPGLAAPSWLGGAHRWSGRAAFLFAVPVAVHCLYAAGFQTFDTRVFLHSLLGCLFFGAFVVKMLGLRRDGLPHWFLPVVGGGVFTALIGLWWTTALRFFETYGSPF
jgi:predicted Abi (CAAX) family protease